MLESQEDGDDEESLVWITSLRFLGSPNLSSSDQEIHRNEGCRWNTILLGGTSCFKLDRAG